MKKSTKQRHSDFELLRIISMFLIVVWHVIVHSQLITQTNGIINIVIRLILIICSIHVNSFVIVTGYFQYKSEYSFKKLKNLFYLQWFYKATIGIVFIWFSLVPFNSIELIKILNPIESGYWFVNAYLVLYLLSPYINKVIKSLDQKEHGSLLLICFIAFSIIPLITNNSTVNNNGYTIINFIFLYLIGSYLSKYPIKKSIYFKNNSDNKNRIIFLFVFILMVIINILVFISLTHINTLTSSSLLNHYSNYYLANYLNYSNPIIIIQSLAYVIIFSLFDFKSKFINRIGSYIFGIYLFHDNYLIRELISKCITKNYGNLFSSKKIIIIIIGCSVIIFIISLIIEFTRKEITNLYFKKNKL